MMKSNRLKKYLLFLCCVLCAASMASCDLPFITLEDYSTGEGSTTEATSAVTTTTTEASSQEQNVPNGDFEMKTYDLTEHVDSLKVIGRSQALSTGITCDWSASGISFTLNCKGDVALTVYSNKVAYFTVIVDGVRQQERVMADEGTATVTLARNLSEGEHSFSFLKQTENTNAMCILKSISFDGSFGEKPADKDLYIEFYGDSITCGYGNLEGSVAAVSPGSALWQDGTQTYAFRTAEALNADWSMISVSGIPFSKGFTQFAMGDIMEKVNWQRGDTAYLFEKKPDLVVINLGTNDALCGADLDDVKVKAKSMIQTLKSHYGEDQKILFVTCMMDNCCRDELLEVIADCGGEDSFIYEFKTTRSNRSGGNGHPNMTAHIGVAEELSSFIRTKILTEV